MLILAAAAGSLAWIGWNGYRTLFRDSTRAPDRYQAVVAYRLGHYVARDLGGTSGVLCLVFPPESAVGADTLDTWFNTFARVLAPFPSLAIKEATVKLSGKQLKQASLELAGFESALAQVPGASAYISFIGVPPGTEKLPPFAGNVPASRLYIFDPHSSTNWLIALKEGRARRVIVPRPGTGQAAARSTAGPPEEIFEQFFLAATPETADQLAARLTTPR